MFALCSAEQNLFWFIEQEIPVRQNDKYKGYVNKWIVFKIIYATPLITLTLSKN